eukprot:3469685-Prymnesium_polylepis.1
MTLTYSESGLAASRMSVCGSIPCFSHSSSTFFVSGTARRAGALACARAATRRSCLATGRRQWTTTGSSLKCCGRTA